MSAFTISSSKVKPPPINGDGILTSTPIFICSGLPSDCDYMSGLFGNQGIKIKTSAELKGFKAAGREPKLHFLHQKVTISLSLFQARIGLIGIEFVDGIVNLCCLRRQVKGRLGNPQNFAHVRLPAPHAKWLVVAGHGPGLARLTDKQTTRLEMQL